MIAQVISNLTDTEDILTCMLLSKEVRQEIFKTPEIMRKIKFVVNHKNLEFFHDQKNFIRCLKIEMLEADIHNFRIILNNSPNLEDLTLKIINNSNTVFKSINSQKYPKIPNLSKLKSLKTSLIGLEVLQKNSKNIKNLEKLSIISSMIDSKDYVEDLINQQNHKEKIQLTFNIENDNSSLSLLEPFGDYLRSLELKNVFSIDTRSVDFDKFKKLTKVSCSALDLNFYRLHNPQSFQIPTVTAFECKTGIITSSHLKLLDLMFPNLKSIKCEDIDATSGSNDKLLNLEINYLSFHNFQHFKFSKLINLTINFSWGLFQYDFWKNSVENLENVENVTIFGYFSEIEAKFLIPHVKNFKNLKKFKFSHKNNVKCKTFEDQIEIDRIRGTVKLPKYIIQNYKQVMKIVHENYVGYEILEI